MLCEVVMKRRRRISNSPVHGKKRVFSVGARLRKGDMKRRIYRKLTFRNSWRNGRTVPPEISKRR